jgi:acetyltransferase
MQPPPIKQEWTTDDGRRITIRTIQPEDLAIEQAFVRGLSAKSKYMRFFSAIEDLSPQMLDRFIHVDYPSEMALIATVETESKEQEIGVARYAREGSENSVEFAIVVADEWQGHGIGRELLRQLFDAATTSGCERIKGIVLRANWKMLLLCHDLGFTVSQYPGDTGLVCVIKDLKSAKTDPCEIQSDAFFGD